MKVINNILVKGLPIILATLMPAIDYFNNLYTGTPGDAFARWLSISLFLLAVWYINVYVSKRGVLTIVISNALFIGVFVTISEFIYPTLFPSSLYPRIFLPAILFFAIQKSLSAVEEKQILATENLRLKSETYKTELENLKSQMNPHFLFNSLTTLQTIIRQNPSTAENFVIKLADFYRKTLLSSRADNISLKDELDYILAYIFLLQSRFEDGLRLEVSLNEESNQYNLPVFALQILIENCIKHNIISDERPLIIRIYQDDPTHVTVQNNLQPRLSKVVSTQIGLANLSKRYELIGIKNGVTIKENQENFSVTIQLF